MSLKVFFLCAVASWAAVGLVQADTATAVEVKEEAFEEAQTFQVGDPIVASANLVITAQSNDPDIAAIANDADIIAEQERNCCPEGGFCCGLEIGCVPVALSVEVMCAVVGPDSPIPCCDRDLLAGETAAPTSAAEIMARRFRK